MRLFSASAAGLLAAALLALACSTPDWHEPVTTTGTFQDVLRDGRTEGRVPLAGIADRDEDAEQGELVALGALEGLEGEVTIVDGEVWLSRVRDGSLTTEVGRGIGGNATLLVSTRVRARAS